MRRIWVCQGDYGRGKDYRWMSVAEFNRSFTVEQAVAYLGQIEKVLRKEALDNSEEGYFYTVLRHVFAEIDGFGKLYCGVFREANTTENAIAFGTEYLGRVSRRYRNSYGLLVDMYRHGLAHTHLTKCVKFRDARNRWITVVGLCPTRRGIAPGT